MEFGKRSVGAALMSAVLVGGMALSGCNDNVEVLRDPDVRIAKGMTWAWRPMTPPPAPQSRRDSDNRPVVSRDVISSAPPPQRLESNRDWNTEANRDQLKKAIEKGLKSKGLVQITNPDMADFLVDYHVAVKSQRATVGTIVSGRLSGRRVRTLRLLVGLGLGTPGSPVPHSPLSRRHVRVGPCSTRAQKARLSCHQHQGFKQQTHDLALSGRTSRGSSFERSEGQR